ncbi:hypothetical protein D3C81_1914520 [compost metagenome]
MRFIGAMMARISNRPQRAAASTAITREIPMMTLAVSTASSMAAMSVSATDLL